MEELQKALIKLTGNLLLDVSGEIYLLKSYEKRVNIRVKKPIWPWQKMSFTERDYISEIVLSRGVPYNYDSNERDQREVRLRVNRMIEDRARYLTLQRTLNRLGAVIITKRFREGEKEKDVKQINKTQPELSGKDNSNKESETST